MGAFITLLLLGVIVYVIVKALKKSNNKKKAVAIRQEVLKKELQEALRDEVKVQVEFHRREDFSFPPPRKNSNGTWTLNPGATFEINLKVDDESIVRTIRDILDDDNIYDYQKEYKLTAIIAQHNVKTVEIEEYKQKYKPIYENIIKECIRNSNEWNELGEKDREDLMSDFKNKALMELEERAHCELDVLFENEPKDISVDDELIEEYGFELLQKYFRLANNLDKVRVIDNSNNNRPVYEELVEKGLAIRGQNIHIEEVLTTLTMKDLNLIADNKEKKYTRKKDAIEFIKNKPNLNDILGKHISFREIFKLQPLPEKYSHIEINEIVKTWNYHTQEVVLLTNTYRSSLEYLWDLSNLEQADKFTVKNYFNGDCKKFQIYFNKGNIAKNEIIKLPLHLGCTCRLSPEYDYTTH